MNRAKKSIENTDQIVDVAEKKIWWRNGGGSFYAIIDGRNKIIKPGEKFQAYEREVPKSFRNSVYSVDPLPDQIPLVVEKIEYEIIPLERDENLFYVVNKKTGKKINAEKPWLKETAESYIVDLSK